MKKAGIAELKNRLSYYLDFVRRGQSVLVYDRDRVVARIEPARASDTDDWTTEMQQSGVLRPPSARLGKDWLRHRPSVNADVVAALLTERDSGW